MKKFASLILALAMTFSLCISAGAVEWTMDDIADVAKKNVTITIGGGETEMEKYYVIVTWGNMNFTYNKANARQWDPEKHEYTDGSEAGWVSNDGATIKVDNHSNKAVNVDAKFDDTDSYTAEKDNITVTMRDANGENTISAPVMLDSAAKEGSLSLTGDNPTARFDAAPTCTYKVKVDTNKVPTAEATFGVTVSISAAS